MTPGIIKAFNFVLFPSKKTGRNNILNVYADIVQTNKNKQKQTNKQTNKNYMFITDYMW